MEIRPLDLADDDVLHQVALVAERVQRDGRPHAPAFSETAHTAWLRSTDSGERQHGLVAVEDGKVVGFGLAWVFLHDNPDIAWLEVEVDPPARRRGTGGALLDALTEVVRREGRTVLLADTKVPFDALETHPHRLFCERRGWVLNNVEVVRHQALPVPEADLDAWSARAAARGDGYRVETFVDEVPEELQESLCHLLALLDVDAPTGGVDFEPETMTPARLAERYAAAKAMDRHVYETVAVAPDGTVAAQTTLSVPRHDPDAFQWGTYVHREHRGHSLGLAVKVANLRAVQADHPHLRRVVTQNAETNQWMIAVNELIGYRAVEAAVELVRRCPPLAAGGTM